MFGSSWLVLFSFVLFFDQFKLLKKKYLHQENEKESKKKNIFCICHNRAVTKPRSKTVGSQDVAWMDIQFAFFRLENESSRYSSLDCWSPDESSRLEYLLIYGQAWFCGDPAVRREFIELFVWCIISTRQPFCLSYWRTTDFLIVSPLNDFLWPLKVQARRQ